MNDSAFTTFRKNFMNMFKKLVPGGRADLELITHDSAFVNIVSQSRITTRSIRIKCLFNQKDQTGQRLLDSTQQSLSPGQRTLLSIALLLGLMKNTKVPFYCFDEIDAELDTDSCERLSHM